MNEYSRSKPRLVVSGRDYTVADVEMGFLEGDTLREKGYWFGLIYEAAGLEPFAVDGLYHPGLHDVFDHGYVLLRHASPPSLWDEYEPLDALQYASTLTPGLGLNDFLIGFASGRLEVSSLTTPLIESEG